MRTVLSAINSSVKFIQDDDGDIVLCNKHVILIDADFIFRKVELKLPTRKDPGHALAAVLEAVPNNAYGIEVVYARKTRWVFSFPEVIIHKGTTHTHDACWRENFDIDDFEIEGEAHTSILTTNGVPVYEDIVNQWRF